ncbi:MAG: hypothetical protein HY394_01545 [Candidatus Diapherotrites archaeon]|nr:hypothetical protein [Candidatus Diapherotrites archaeon]
MDSRGQESAPFELLVAVIVMGFVIAIGYQALGILNNQLCEGKIEASLNNFRSKLEIAVTQKTPQEFSFELPCYNKAKSSVKIQEWRDAKICANECQRSSDACTLLTYTYSGSENPDFSVRTCLEIPITTSFPSQENCGTGSKCDCRDAPDQGGFILQNFSIAVPDGKYQLVNKTDVQDPNPTVCAYWKGR